MIQSSHSKADETGASLVEMALVLPLLLLLIFGVVEFGRFLSMQHGVSTAAREAARFGVAVGGTPPQYTDCDGIANAAIGLSGLGNVSAADVDIRYIESDGTPIIECPADSADIQDEVEDGDRVEVTVSRPFNAIIPVTVLPSTITALDTRTIFLVNP